MGYKPSLVYIYFLYLGVSSKVIDSPLYTYINVHMTILADISVASSFKPQKASDFISQSSRLMPKYACITLERHETIIFVQKNPQMT